MINISLEPEYILKIGSFGVFNTLFCSWLTTIILIIIALFIKTRIKKVPEALSLQNVFETIIDYLLKYIKNISSSEKLAYEVFPLIATFFIFIVSENLLALLPGFLGSFFVNVGGEKISLLKSPNADLNSTLALAIISVVSIQYFGIKMLGAKKYLKRFFNFANPFKLFLGIFEMISDVNKLLSLSLRLFGNVLAGEVLLMAIAFFLPFFLPLPFMIFEIFVGIIQAFIFATLSLVFIKSAEMEI